MQSLTLLVSAVLMLVVATCFGWVIAHSRGQSSLEEVSKPAYRARGRLFAGVMLVGIALTLFTLVPWPHDSGAAEVTRSIDVTGRQWSWNLSDQRARVGDVVEFRVTSDDVNHGFALYDPHQRVVAQIQAMPGFTNKVRHRFTEPGTYRVLCLEYCGLVHHGMATEIQVQPAAAP